MAGLWVQIPLLFVGENVIVAKGYFAKFKLREIDLFQGTLA